MIRLCVTVCHQRPFYCRHSSRAMKFRRPLCIPHKEGKSDCKLARLGNGQTAHYSLRAVVSTETLCQLSNAPCASIYRSYWPAAPCKAKPFR